jgi:hypothetical protein
MATFSTFVRASFAMPSTRLPTRPSKIFLSVARSRDGNKLATVSEDNVAKAAGSEDWARVVYPQMAIKNFALSAGAAAERNKFATQDNTSRVWDAGTG